MTLRTSFVKTVSRLMDERSELVLCLGDISVHALRAVFAKHPKRCYNLGICESASVDVCAGLSMSGLTPLYHTIDAFMVRRAFEAMHVGFGLQRLPGVFVSVGGSCDYAKLGPTHQCEHGPTLMAQIPGMHIRMPVTPETVDLAISTAVEKRQLSYIRLEETAVVQAAEVPRKVLHLPLAGARNGLDTGPGRPGRPPAA